VERWHAQVCSDQKEPGSEDDASADEAVLCLLIESGQGLILGHIRRTDFRSHRLELKQLYLLLYGPYPK
jgi:hypothetical protein